MTRTSSRKLLIAALATLTLGTGLAAPAAEAHPIGWGWGGYHHGYYGHGYYGLGGVGLGLGLLAAATVGVGGSCWIQRQVFVDRFNRTRVRNVEVCN